MEIVNLKCNNCGADLKIKPNVKFFNCSFCKSALTLKQSGNITYTEVLGEIKENTDILLNHSERLLIEKEIARLDRAWLVEQEQYKISGKNGSELPNEYTGVSAILSFIFAIGFMTFWFSNLSSIGSEGGAFGVFGLIVLVIFVVNVFSNLSKNEKYRTAKQSYEDKRFELLARLEML